MRPYLLTAFMLICSNFFMTFAWYGHLKNLSHKPWIIAVFVSWSIALFEYLLQVPANRIGHSVMNIGELKIYKRLSPSLSSSPSPFFTCGKRLPGTISGLVCAF